MLNLSVLAYFKYAMFALAQTNSLLRWWGAPPLDIPRVVLPLGISFFTFQGISYLVDVYRRTTPPQRHPLRLGLYISFFPQLIAGPIVRYQELNEQLTGRRRDWAGAARGLERFIIGLAKKVLLANTLGGIVDELFALDFTTMPAAAAWAGALLYALQLYYDFSGYSDMAIGLGLLFGFRLPENFNFPYASKSIREFWRRWHITLGAWFRDYLYFPLGGSRGGARKTARNLLLVFLATGLWHGAGWAFLLWGLWHGLFIVLERQRWWPGNHLLYAQLVVLLGWVLFRTESLPLSLQYYRAMVGGNDRILPFDWSFYWSSELSIALLIALAGCWPWWRGWALSSQGARGFGTLMAGGRLLGLLALFMLVTNALVNNALNPFIYFRF